MVERIEGFRDAFQLHAFCESEGSAETGIESEEIEPDASIATNYCSPQRFCARVQATIRAEAEAWSAGPL